MPKHHVMDLFCGTGGFSWGFAHHPAEKFEVVFGLDLLPVATQTFRLNHPKATVVCGDIRRWEPQEVAREFGLRKGAVDVIVGGPPCQGFSSIRPHRSSEEDDHRNFLYRGFVDYVRYYSPEYFVMENVVGLATHGGGKTISDIVKAFGHVGYNVDWKIVNAANYGVPQRRERLVMIGARRPQGVVFPKPSHRAEGRTIGHRNRGKMLSTHADELGNRSLPKALTVVDGIGDLPPIKAGDEATSYDAPARNAYQAMMRQGSRSLTLHRATGHTKRMLRIIKHSGDNISHIPKGLVTSGFSSCYSRLDPDLPAVTLTVNFVHPASNKCIHPHQNRALTPREGARLQSFPDAFQFAGSRTQIVKQMGNAVPPLLGRVIAESLLRMDGKTVSTLEPYLAAP